MAQPARRTQSEAPPPVDPTPSRRAYRLRAGEAPGARRARARAPPRGLPLRLRPARCWRRSRRCSCSRSGTRSSGSSACEASATGSGSPGLCPSALLKRCARVNGLHGPRSHASPPHIGQFGSVATIGDAVAAAAAPELALRPVAGRVEVDGIALLARVSPRHVDHPSDPFLDARSGGIRPPVCPYCARANARAVSAVRSVLRPRTGAAGDALPRNDGFWALGERLTWLAGLVLADLGLHGLVRRLGRGRARRSASSAGTRARSASSSSSSASPSLALAALREAGFELPAVVPESLVVIALGALATIFVLIRADLDPRPIPPRRRARDRDLDQPGGCAGRNRRRAAASSRRAVATRTPRSGAGERRRAGSGRRRRRATTRSAPPGRRGAARAAARHVRARHGRAREARRRVARRERDVVCRVARAGPARGGPAYGRGRSVEELDGRRGEVGERDADERSASAGRAVSDARTSTSASQDQPARAERAGVGKPDRRTGRATSTRCSTTQRCEVVVDAGEEGRQARAASICFADSISCCGSNGLPMKPCAPRSVASAADVLVDLAAEHHHRDRADAVALLHPRSISQPSTLRHHHVEQDEVGRLLLERRQPLLRVRRLADGVALQLEVRRGRTRAGRRRRRRSGRAGPPRLAPPGPERSRNASRSARR